MNEIDGLGEWPRSNPHEQSGAELCAENCDDSCDHEEEDKLWMAKEDKLYCDVCLVEYWYDELMTFVLDAAGWDGDTDEDLIFEKFVFTTDCDDEFEFTHFNVSSLLPFVDRFEVTLAMLEAKRAKLVAEAKKANNKGENQ